jgi:hypothetical protein
MKGRKLFGDFAPSLSGDLLALSRSVDIDFGIGALLSLL